MMVETIEKATFLEKVQSVYEQLNTLLATLSDEQKTTPGVNGSWSVKDNIAHITAWQDLLPARIQGWITGSQKPVEFPPEFKTDDEINEYIYQQNKDRPLVEVEAAFQSSYRRAREAIESVSEETLNAPARGKSEGPLLWRYIESEICEHYEEHDNTIRRWLKKALAI